MPGSRVVPASFVFSDKHREQVKTEFKIDDTEVDRILTIIGEHEFARPYTHWHLVALRWFRTANERGELKRPRQYTTTKAELTDDERASDQLAFERDMRRLRVVK